MDITVDVAVLLAVIAILLLRRPVQARKRSDTLLTMIIVLILGILIAPTEFGQGVVNMVGQIANSLSGIGS
ncbi:hypothetical protein [Streptomyces sp. VRA16 Mangrove soil]|uniref:hypothetical protein n=1 Tax=Streptomyces sp. VRA16 Mangrove soil TaxID=2817434 RepID=UPI001A9CCCA3|nr:hypothetical protein [Streptomyces sp. VRA16 Mangrove soil]MBO1330652.1 hypothetical protein [Streptomyces sp. VRA16 Mangrove soil]